MNLLGGAMTEGTQADFAQIQDHPGFLFYQAGLRRSLARAQEDLERYEGEPGMDFQIGMIRLQERIKMIRWVLETYPDLLTTTPPSGQHSGVATGEDVYGEGQ